MFNRAEVDLDHLDARASLRRARELSEIEQADSTCHYNAWAMGTRQNRFHLVLAIDWANRPVGFAAADARDGHITVHEVSIADEAKQRFPKLHGELLDELIEGCQTAWGDVTVSHRSDLVDHLTSQGWAINEAAAGRVRLSGARLDGDRS